MFNFRYLYNYLTPSKLLNKALKLLLFVYVHTCTYYENKSGTLNLLAAYMKFTNNQVIKKGVTKVLDFSEFFHFCEMLQNNYHYLVFTKYLLNWKYLMGWLWISTELQLSCLLPKWHYRWQLEAIMSYGLWFIFKLFK